MHCTALWINFIVLKVL